MAKEGKTSVKSVEWSRELKKGSLQVCLLALLSNGRRYGFQIIKELKERTNEYIDLKEGTLYPALHRLEKAGLLKSEWVTEGTGNPRKYYSLTPEGKKGLKEAIEAWETMVDSCNNVIKGVKL